MLKRCIQGLLRNVARLASSVLTRPIGEGGRGLKLTINVPVVFTARFVMIFRRAICNTGAIIRGGP